jgi:hypothetical protein
MNPASLLDSNSYYAPPHRREAGDAEPRVRALIEAVEKAKDAVLVAVMAAMDAAARRLKITKIDVLGTTTLYRGKREIENREMAAIEALYLEVHPGGFMGLWTAKDGWK